MMDNCNLTAYGLCPPELCKDLIRVFLEDYVEKFLEDQQELRNELERICSAHTQPPGA